MHPPGDGVIDTAIDAAIDTPTCPGGMACERFVFVTSREYTANLGGPSGADAICQTHADHADAPLRGRFFRAWLGSAATPAASRHLHGSMPYRLRNGTAIANDWGDLTDGLLAAPIDVTELGGSYVAAVWTATATNGDALAQDCDTWASTGSTGGATGNASKTDHSWTDAGGATGCATTLALYCFEM